MTQNDFFKEYDKYIRGLIYKNCKSEDMRDDVYSEVVMSLLSSGTVFDLPKPAQIVYIRKAVECTSYCKRKSLKKSKTYGDLQSDDNDADPEEYAIPDDRYSPDTEKQDFARRDKALELAEQWKTTKKLISKLRQKTHVGISNLGNYSTNRCSGSKASQLKLEVNSFCSPIKTRLNKYKNKRRKRNEQQTI